MTPPVLYAAATCIGVAVPLIAVGGGLFWWREQRRLAKDVLKLKRTKVEPGSDKDLPSDVLNITRFMKIDWENAKLEPFNQAKMVSAADYAAALSVPGNFNWRKAARTLLVQMNLRFLLPMTALVGSSDKDEGGTDPFAVVGGSDAAYAILRDAFSPLHLYALGELTNLVTASQNPLEVEETCVMKFLRGDGVLPEDMQDLPQPFVLEEHLPGLLAGLDPEGDAGTIPPPDAPSWLPDLASSHVGQTLNTNDFQAKCGLVFAVLLNRLSSNTMPDAWRPQQFKGRSTTVRVSRDGPDITTPGGLINAIDASMGASIDMGIVTRTTSFGKGFALHQDGEWLQLPFVLPLRTGITMLEGMAASSGTREVTTLMPHAEIKLRVKAPTFNFRISYYQGIEGFTGWHSGREADQPWNNSSAMELEHSTWTRPEEYAAAADIAAMVATATNNTADELDLPNGGYGYLGVCHDSVAIVQAALQEEVTVFPCLLAGQAETIMSRMYSEIHDTCMEQGNDERAAVAEQVKHALLRTPCDVVHEPTSMHDAIRRVAACTPPVTPFVTLERCREDLKKVATQLDAVGIYADKAQHALSGRATAKVTHLATGAAKESGELQVEATAT
eukprot:jgi/Ulvmu1/10341/UM061_0024.1